MKNKAHRLVDKIYEQLLKKKAMEVEATKPKPKYRFPIPDKPTKKS